MRGRTAGALAVFVVALAAAALLKRHYSVASPDDLRWILAPTTALVELVTGADFVFERGAGYLSTELRFLIAPSCAGVNFLIIAFAALVAGFVRPHRRLRDNAAILGLAAAAAYATTIVANTLRIAIAIPLHTQQVRWGWLDGDRLHVLAGVVVYLGTLLALFAAARRVARAPGRAWWLPFAIYVAVALGVPLVNGAASRAGFWEHAAIVGAVLAAVGLATVVARRLFATYP